ncbi:ribonuclease J [Methylobacterium haplocladii]|uniref:RNase J family beta-CASP ribonuclease n=1 Tax=Methylobacterium haplocladii TaxID=1176176 RepID=A0A512IT61_9HYPH|nr:ribonuclease J [Methylobacterium haplocladii]GEP00819.1 RNase J family beta-CASP ribonuclease [Methylobacterium haplocladii]GJD85207.1 Ribonuclease J [Methylobacterium haplocladii]GLS59287.1 RNase J family beta-CASP ribonuclease [Methylobacterium haplocladii]
MTSRQDELVFVPLGGVGEIGMNAALYGIGPEKSRKWIMVDLGMGFAGEEGLPGIELMFPDLTFIEERKQDLLGIFITHAHEDHIGAVSELWSKLKAPVYATRFAKQLLETRRLSEPGAPKVVLKEIKVGQRLQIGPFEIEYVPVAHSIPESNAVAIRTEHGLVLHTGDWKLDDTPVAGATTSPEAFKALGDEGIIALVCDSTNIMREGRSHSEAEVSATLKRLIAEAPHRVAVTTFASNVARIRAVAEAAQACGREVLAVGRAMDRVIDVARECGYLDGLPDFRSADSYHHLPRDKVVCLLTGSQGEDRAAMARVSRDDHPAVSLTAGDRVIFSSRAIPGNERDVGAIINDLIDMGVEIITDRTELVHVSGHPRRDEMAAMYAWTRPQATIPVHGEALHLDEHARFARAQGVETVVKARNGTMIRLAPGKPEIIEHVRAGRLYKDANVLIDAKDRAIPERRKLAQAGIVSVAIAIDNRGTVLGTPAVDIMGLPNKGRGGEALIDTVAETVSRTLSGLSPGKRRDSEAVENAVDRAIRSALNDVWGKKPACHVQVVEI